MHSITDHQNGETTVYVYDDMGRTIHSGVYDTATYENVYCKHVSYGEESRVSSFADEISYTVGSADSTRLRYTYTYDDAGRISKLVLSDGATISNTDIATITPTYDNFGRTESKVMDFNINSSDAFYNSLTYDYKSSGTNESMLVSQLVSGVGKSGVTSSTTYNYTYDDNGNITKITDASGVIQYQYHYDELDQLIREDNRALGKTYVWTYDNSGNILTRKEYAFTTSTTLGTLVSTKSYTYNAGGIWNDRLTSYNGSTITYDDVGNPITIGGIPLTWEGRQLVEYGTAAAFSYKYTYNADGIRTSKNIDGTVHTYVLDGSRIVSETINSAYIFIYLYDEAGSPIGIKFRGANYAAGEYDYFFFEKNLQGDIVAIYNESGAKVATYIYDAWGKVTTTYVSTNSIERYVANNNPFRYRGYYYDLETGLYYLQSRYYNPTWGRFLNADSYVSTGTNDILGYNMYAYCNNNPIKLVDSTGEFSVLIVLALILLPTVIGAVLGATADYDLTKEHEEKTEQKGSQDSEGYIDDEPTEISTSTRIKNTVLGASLGLLAGGALVATGGTIAGVAGTSFLGVSAAQTFAIGALAFDFSAICVLPFFGAEVDPIECEPIQMPQV